MILLQDTREYDSSDWENRSSFPSTPSSSSQDGLANASRRHIRLNPDATLVLGWQMREESHYKAHAVMDRWRRRRFDLVARVYRLDTETVPLKVRRHRLRCINRLASRTILEVSVPNFRIVVYRSSVNSEAACLDVSSLQNASDSAFSEELEDNTERGGVGLQLGVIEARREASEELEPGVDDACHKKKTPYQQESKKVRQRERRQVARRVKREKATLTESPSSTEGHLDGAGSHAAVSLDDSENPENFYLLVLLYLAYDEKGQLYGAERAQTLTGMSSTLMGYLRSYLNQEALDFTSAGQMQEYLDVKQSEIIFLTRLQSKMGRIDQHYKDQLLIAMREKQARRASSSEPWTAQQEQLIQIAQHQLKVVRHVTNALPGVIRKAKETHRELKLRVAQARQEEEEKERLKDLRSEREAREEKVRALAAWIRSVVPCSTTYRELEERYRAAGRELK